MDLERRAGDQSSGLDTAVVVPTFNEADNVSELVHQLNVAFADWAPDSLEIFFVDDSTDDTPDRISDAQRAVASPFACSTEMRPPGRVAWQPRWPPHWW